LEVYACNKGINIINALLRIMKIFKFEWGMVFVYVIAETKEDALKKIRDPQSVANQEYPNYKFGRDPEYWEEHDEMMTHYGWG
jgi:hypothetical protein